MVFTNSYIQYVFFNTFCMFYFAFEITGNQTSNTYRNCLVGRRFEVKVSDIGSYRQIYSTDYCQIAGSRPLPLRWMAWESVLLVSNLYF